MATRSGNLSRCAGVALQRAESEFDPVPFGVEAARIFGRVTAAVLTAGHKPRRRAADLMIAATAISEGLPLFTTSPDDFTGLDALVHVVPVIRPPVPHESPAGHQYIRSRGARAGEPDARPAKNRGRVGTRVTRHGHRRLRCRHGTEFLPAADLLTRRGPQHVPAVPGPSPGQGCRVMAAEKE
jgi:hypothetical protein